MGNRDLTSDLELFDQFLRDAERPPTQANIIHRLFAFLFGRSAWRS